MPRITSQNTAQLSLLTIRNFLNAAGPSIPIPGTTNISLSSLELAYMGNNTSGGTNKIVTLSKVCMWQQQEKVSGGLPSLPVSSPRSWDYSGPSVPYAPSRVSEFQQAYYPIPSGSGAPQATGAANSTGNIVLTFAGGALASGVGSNYYFFLSIANNMGPWAANTWYSSSGYTQTLTNVINGGNCQGFLVDDRICGGQVLSPDEIMLTGTLHYP